MGKKKLKINFNVFIFKIDDCFCTFDMKHPLKFYLLLEEKRNKNNELISVVIAEINPLFPHQANVN